eukprot:TRINITY_DN1350_c0_g5_i1.p2 TRINITY_DN1350_c0_g5~~TRINITY_DN1350_c0_g5_i1.p2  ORF type:complete len:165 (+),score=16.17 TRINITY_DN1350_c0_g5_i1:68-496(+)
MQAKGLPLVRHPLLHYPNNLQAQALRWQFMLGDSVMVCPVLDSGKITVECYLPDAFQWFPIWLLADDDDVDLLQKYQDFVSQSTLIDEGVWLDSPADSLCPAVFFKNSRPPSLDGVVSFLQSNYDYLQKCRKSWSVRLQGVN